MQADRTATVLKNFFYYYCIRSIYVLVYCVNVIAKSY